MSHEYYNIVIGGEGVRRRSNGINAEKITFFSNFVRVSKGLLSTIVAFSANLGLICIPHPGMGPLAESPFRRTAE